MAAVEDPGLLVDFAHRAHHQVTLRQTALDEARDARAHACRMLLADGWTYHAIARLLGVTPQGVRKFIHRGQEREGTGSR